MAVPTAKILKAQGYLAWGDDLGDEDKLFEFTEATSTTGNTSAKIPKKLAAGATDSSVDLSTFCTTATYIAVKDEGGTGIKVGHAAGAGKTQIAANGFLIFKNGVATPPTLYFDNVSGATDAYLSILVMGARS